MIIMPELILYRKIFWRTPLSINKEKAEIFEKEFRENGECPKRWVWVCLKYINYYMGDPKDKMDMAKDIVLEIIAQTISESLSWDMEKETLDKHMYSKIWNKVSHLSAKRNRIVENERFDEKSGEKFEIIDNTSEYSKEEIELQIDNKDLIERCYEEIKDDTDMGLVFELLREGKTPKEIENEYGITPEEVDAIKKRIKRLLTKIYEQEYYS